MSFTKMKFEDLVVIADRDFAVDTTGMKTKGEVVEALGAAGVTWDMYERMETARQEKLAELAEQAAAEAEADLEPVEDEVVVTKTRRGRPASRDVLVKMHRQNAYYETNGKKFTREHPFVVMSEEDAQIIFDLEDGFHLATPREAQEYYS